MTQLSLTGSDMKRILTGALAALLSFAALAATTTPVQLLNPAGSTTGQAIVSTGASTAPAWGLVPLTGISGLGTAASVNTGTSGATIPLLNTANTWTLQQAFTVRPAFNGATPVDSANVLTAVPGRLLNVQVFTSSGTYTPTAGATKAIVEVMAPGGGSGGTAATSTGQTAMASAGNAGAYGKIWIASGLTTTTVTIGAIGAAGTTAPTAGGTGGTTSFGALIVCTGGVGGPAGSAVANTASFTAFPGTPAASCSGTGTFLVSGTGAPGEKGIYAAATPAFEAPGTGGSTMWGSGGQGRTLTPSPGTGYGAGAGASFASASAAAVAGAAGAPAVVIIQEFN